MTDAIRTAVLARAGAARDRVAEGLAEAGAELVGTLDPTVHAPDDLDALAPTVLVVVLDPADEDVLEAFEPAFVAPGRTVIFEEAALVLERTGWDAARWVRHLGAKIRGQGDVLPPSAQAAAPEPDVGTPAVPPVADDAPPALASLTLEYDAHGDTAPTGASVLEDASAGPQAPGAIAPSMADDAAGTAAPATDGHPRGDDVEAREASGAPAHVAFDPVAAEFDAHAAPPAQDLAFDFDFELDAYDEMSYTPPAAPPGEVRDLDENLAAISGAPAPAAPRVESSSVVPPPLPDPVERPPLRLQDGAPATAAFADALPDTRVVAPSGLSLVDDDAGMPPPAATAARTPAARDYGDLESRIAGLSLVDADSYGHGTSKGVVLIAGGLGGPDAVRQLLGALPEGFPRPVLVRLQLDGGRYDRLVRQMERATAMPVQLAEAGMSLSPGEVYFLPPDLLPVSTAGGLRFAQSADVAALATAVAVDDSALVFLSGADPALVDVAMGPAWQGALVGGQHEAGCYDPVAARAVAQRGGPTGSPSDIVDWLLARWMPGARNFNSGGLSL